VGESGTAARAALMKFRSLPREQFVEARFGSASALAITCLLTCSSRKSGEVGSLRPTVDPIVLTNDLYVASITKSVAPTACHSTTVLHRLNHRST